MRAVTHQTVDYFPGLLYNLVFLGMAVLYARIPRKARAMSKGGGTSPPPPLNGTVSATKLEPPAPSTRAPIPLAPAKKRDLSELE